MVRRREYAYQATDSDDSGAQQRHVTTVSPVHGRVLYPPRNEMKRIRYCPSVTILTRPLWWTGRGIGSLPVIPLLWCRGALRSWTKYLSSGISLPICERVRRTLDAFRRFGYPGYTKVVMEFRIQTQEGGIWLSAKNRIRYMQARTRPIFFRLYGATLMKRRVSVIEHA